MNKDVKTFVLLLEQWLSLSQKARWRKMRDYAQVQEELKRKTGVRPAYQSSKLFEIWACSDDGKACLSYWEGKRHD